MLFKWLCALMALTISVSANSRKFPDNFMFGVASSAYQIEGAWNEDGKGESIWDYFIHKDPSLIDNEDNADVACDSYHKVKEDVQLLKSLGVKHYRFSISWPRLLPTGLIDNVNTKAIDYYKNLIDELKKNDIKIIATLYHWDLPMSIQNLGGWINNLTVQYFKDYARVALTNFQDVDYWITFNEPCQLCIGGYGTGDFAPFLHGDGEFDYICAKNILLAHAEVYHLKKELGVKGLMSMTMHFPWGIPKTNLQPDRQAVDRFRQFWFGMYANPIYKGDWPQVVKDRVFERSLNEYGTVERCRLPKITDVGRIKGTSDFIAVNYYYSHIIEDDVEDLDYTKISFKKDMRIKMSTDESWEIGYNGTRIYPEGLRDLLYWLRMSYGSQPIIITENGIPDIDNVHDDTKRKKFITNHLNAVLDAIDWGVNVIGYTYWSFMDNFEWRHGYKVKYGLYQVDFTNENRTRTPKGAVDFYRKIISNNALP